MNILIDICHIAQLNFYKPLIEILSNSGHTVCITMLDRGRLLKVLDKEIGSFKNVTIVSLGKHKLNKWSVLFESNILRVIKMVVWSLDKRIDIVFGNGFHPHIISLLKHVPSYAFDDDPQTIDFWPKAWLCTESNFCIWKDRNRIAKGKVHVLPVLKEWAYLNLNTFEPKINVLKKYGIEPKKYIFVREVSVGTTNYAKQTSNSILQIVDRFPKGIMVLLSLEEKKKKLLYPNKWILLQEPIEDIHSVIYYSAGLISSGDSMAREAALLGVPAYYFGIRYSMPANLAASEVALLQNSETMSIDDWFNSLEYSNLAFERQKLIRKSIDDKFMDINEYMCDLINKKKSNH